jgi:hypothetical protein
LDSAPTERSNIGKQSLNTSEAEKNTSKASPTLIFIAGQIIEGVVRIESFQNGVVVPVVVSLFY